MLAKIKTIITKAKEKTNALMVGTTAGFIGAMNPVMANAAGSDLFGNAEKLMNNIRSGIVHMATPLYGLVAAVCFIMMLASSGKKAEQAKDWFIRATIAFLAILMVSTIVGFVSNMAK